MGRVAHLHERVVARVHSIADAAVIINLQAVKNVLGRAGDLDVANHTRGVTGAALLILDLDGKFRSGFGRRQLCLQRLEINIEHRRALARDAVVVHAVHAVGGDLHLENGLPMLVADGFHRCSGVRQLFRQFAVFGLQCDEFTKPVGRNFHFLS